jgi:6-phosphogluconolactonase
MAFHPSAPFAYVIHETDSKMTAMSFDTSTGRLAPIQTVSTLPAGVNAATNTGAEVAFGASGHFLYGSNRGDDSIVMFSVDATSGMMTLVGHTKTGGMTPRQFSIDPSGKLLLVGNQGSNEITVFDVDPQSGKLSNPVPTALPASPEFVRVIYLL